MRRRRRAYIAWLEKRASNDGGEIDEMAMAIRERTDVGNLWIAERLAMDHPTSVSRLVAAGKTDKKRMVEKNELVRKLDVQ